MKWLKLSCKLIQLPLQNVLVLIYICQCPYILDTTFRDHEFEPNCSSQIWHDNDFFYFYISEDSFGHHLSQIFI